MGIATNSAAQAQPNSALRANVRTERRYLGDVMLHCLVSPSAFQHCCAVIVTGDPGNPCGHSLLHTGGGWYFHVAGGHTVPRFMSEGGYKRYLRENGKQEIRRWPIKVPDPVGAHRKMQELLARQWLWLGIPQNCVSFVEEIVRAGGSKAGMYFNCPSAEPFA